MKNMLIIFFATISFFLFAYPTIAQGCGDIITTDITLTSDIGPCATDGLVVGAPNIVINCANHKIIGDKTSGKSGILVNGFNGIQIRNCEIYDFSRGITLAQSNSHVVELNNIHNNLQDGIYISNSNNNLISDNTIDSNNKNGLYIYRSDYNNIIDNTVRYNDFGVLASYSRFNSYIGNHFNNNNIAGVSLRRDANNNFLDSNDMNNNKIGLNIERGKDNVIQYNTMHSNSEDGIHIRLYSTGNTFQYNTIDYNKIGFNSYMLADSSLTILDNDILYNTEKGISIDDGSVNIRLNSIEHSNIGIYLFSTTGNNAPNNIVSNRICYNNIAIKTLETDLYTIQPTFFSSNSWCGASNTQIAEQSWKVNVKTIDINSNPVEGATVEVFEKGSAVPLHTLTTYENGYTPEFELTQFKIDATGIKTDKTPHMFTGYKTDFGTDSETVTINKNTEVVLQLVPTTVELTPIDDAYVNQANPTTNYGLQSVLQTAPTANSIKRSFLKFDISQFSGKEVVQAKLRLCRDTSGTGVRDIGVTSVDDNSWTEGTITWNNQPSLGVLYGTTTILGGTGCQWYEFDITPYIKGEAQTNQLLTSLAVVDTQESSGSLTLYYRSEEYTGTTYDPRLIVMYLDMSTTDPDTTPPTVVLNAPVNGVILDNPVVNFLFTATDDIAQTLTCRLFTDRTGTMQQEQSKQVQSGVQNSFTSTFNEGVYKWNVKCDDGINFAFAPSDYLFTIDIPGTPTTTKFAPTHDTYVDEQYPTSNYGVKSYISTKPNTNYRRRSLLKFDVSSVLGQTISNAKLYLCRDTTATGVSQIGVYELADDSWIETTTTWSNKPVEGALVNFVNVNGGSGCQWYSFDVTNYIVAQVSASDTTISMMLKDLNENTNGLTMFFRSKESSGTTYDPYLEITTIS